MNNPYTLCGRATPQTALSVLEVVRPQGERPAAVFFPLGYPYPYGSDGHPQDGSLHPSLHPISTPPSIILSCLFTPHFFHLLLLEDFSVVEAGENSE
jgi:hypothetical protein